MLRTLGGSSREDLRGREIGMEVDTLPLLWEKSTFSILSTIPNSFRQLEQTWSTTTGLERIKHRPQARSRIIMSFRQTSFQMCNQRKHSWLGREARGLDIMEKQLIFDVLDPDL